MYRFKQIIKIYPPILAIFRVSKKNFPGNMPGPYKVVRGFARLCLKYLILATALEKNTQISRINVLKDYVFNTLKLNPKMRLKT